MKKGLLSMFAVVLIAATFLYAPARVDAVATEDDAGTPSIGLAVGEVPAMTVKHVVLDFDLMPAGATTLAAIQATFPGSALAALSFVTRGGTGLYQFQTDGGRGLSANPDGSGNLYLVDPPAGIYGNADSLTIDLLVAVKQLGFEVGDWAGPFNVNLFAGATPIGTIQVSTAGGALAHVIESDVVFDRVVLTALPDNPEANWVVASLLIPLAGVAAAPTLSPLALMLAILLFAALGIVALRHRRA